MTEEKRQDAILIRRIRKKKILKELLEAPILSKRFQRLSTLFKKSNNHLKSVIFKNGGIHSKLSKDTGFNKEFGERIGEQLLIMKKRRKES